MFHLGLKFCLTTDKTSIQIFFVFSEPSDIHVEPSDDVWKLPSLFILKSNILECELFWSLIFAHEVMFTLKHNINQFVLQECGILLEGCLTGGAI